eukprot:scaffold75562_cov33-Tisochrysis_lutea.AAC.3
MHAAICEGGRRHGHHLWRQLQVVHHDKTLGARSTRLGEFASNRKRHLEIMRAALLRVLWPLAGKQCAPAGMALAYPSTSVERDPRHIPDRCRRWMHLREGRRCEQAGTP